MGTQWVRNEEADLNDFGPRPTYQPRHAKTRRHHPRTRYPAGQLPALAAGQGIAERIRASVPGDDAWPPGSVRQVLRDRAAIFVRAHSRGNGAMPGA